MPLVEVGPGYVSPASGGYAAPGAPVPAPAAPTAPPVFTIPRDTFNGAPAVPGGPVPAPSSPIVPAPAPATGGTYQAKSFLSNLWDQFIGPLLKGIVNFFSGLFGKVAGGSAPATASIPSR